MISLKDNKRSYGYNSQFDQRPVWALVSSAGSTTRTPLVTWYGQNPYHPIKMTLPVATDLEGTTSYCFGSNPSPVNSNDQNPSNGHWGITNCRNTASLMNFRLTTDGAMLDYGSVQSGHSLASMDVGVVLGETGFRQDFDLLLTSTGILRKAQLYDVLVPTSAGALPCVNFAALAGNKTDTSNVYGHGQVSYNRKTKHLLIARPTAGAAGSLTYRVYLLDLQLLISRSTTVDSISQAITAAIAQAGRYREMTVTFASANISYGTGTSCHTGFWGKFVLCNDDSFWFMPFGINTTTIVAAQPGAGGAFAATPYVLSYNTPLAVSGMSRHNPSDNNHLHGTAHMVSDDGSCVALYQPYYYYLAGAVVYTCPTASAVGPTLYTHAVATEQVSIAPAGGADFVMTRAANSDSAVGGYVGVFQGKGNGAANLAAFAAYMYPTLSQSTSSGSCAVFKVQPAVGA